MPGAFTPKRQPTPELSPDLAAALLPAVLNQYPYPVEGPARLLLGPEERARVTEFDERQRSNVLGAASAAAAVSQAAEAGRRAREAALAARRYTGSVPGVTPEAQDYLASDPAAMRAFAARQGAAFAPMTPYQQGQLAESRARTDLSALTAQSLAAHRAARLRLAQASNARAAATDDLTRRKLDLQIGKLRRDLSATTSSFRFPGNSIEAASFNAVIDAYPPEDRPFAFRALAQQRATAGRLVSIQDPTDPAKTISVMSAPIDLTQLHKQVEDIRGASETDDMTLAYPLVGAGAPPLGIRGGAVVGGPKLPEDVRQKREMAVSALQSLQSFRQELSPSAYPTWNMFLSSLPIEKGRNQEALIEQAAQVVTKHFYAGAVSKYELEARKRAMMPKPFDPAQTVSYKLGYLERVLNDLASRGTTDLSPPDRDYTPEETAAITAKSRSLMRNGLPPDAAFDEAVKQLGLHNKSETR